MSREMFARGPRRRIQLSNHNFRDGALLLYERVGATQRKLVLYRLIFFILYDIYIYLDILLLQLLEENFVKY